VAKLKAPLLSLGASGAIGKALVYFGWKGLDVVREYVIPANPKSDLQVAHRAHLTEAVAEIHTLEAAAAWNLVSIDKVAYALYGSTFPTPRTWFNQIVQRWIIAKVNAEHPQILVQGQFTDVGAGATTFILLNNYYGAEAGFMCCGTSKTALTKKVAADGVAFIHTGAFTGLTKGVKYYFQFRPTKVTEDKYVARSGIYTHVQAA